MNVSTLAREASSAAKRLPLARSVMPPSRARDEHVTPKVAGNTATIRIDALIDSWGAEGGISAKEFTAALDALPTTVDTIDLRINSAGGEVFEAIAILNALRNHPARVVATVEGIAASSASFIAAGADELVMNRNAELMIHDVWIALAGNAAELRSAAEIVDRLSDNIASIYAAKASGKATAWRQMMLVETWFTADEAVAAGVADRVDTTVSAVASNRVDVSRFRFAGRAAAGPPRVAPAERTPLERGEPGSPASEIAQFRRELAALGLT